jgi:tetratricopeptide (TPR) repeat protein
MVGLCYRNWLFIYFILTAAAFAAEDPVCNLAAYYMQQGNYPAAITEYRRYLFFNPQTKQTGEIYYKMSQAYQAEKAYDDAITHLQYALDLEENQRIKSERTLELALLLVKIGNYNGAKLKLIKIVHLSPDQDLCLKAVYFLGVCSVLEANWEAARSHFTSYFIESDSTVMPELSALYAIQNKHTYKSPKLAKWLSTIIPGTGQMYAGDYRHGLNAMGVNILFGYLVYYGIAHGEILDVLIVYFTLFERYYRGNRYHAQRLAQEYNTKLDDAFRQQVTGFLYRQAK